MEKIFVTETFTKEVAKYRASDGMIFDTPADCEAHEWELDREEIKDIKVCNELDHCPPFDGGDYWNSYEYEWFYPTTHDHIRGLRKLFPDAEFTDDDVNHWICVEHCDCYAASITLESCIEYARYILDKLGYEMTVNPKTNA